MLKVLQIIPTLDQSGAEKQMTLLAVGLPREEFDVHVAVLTRTGPLAQQLDAAGIPYTLINKSLKADPFAYWRLKRLIRKIHPHVVHTWLFAGNSYGRAAAIACRVPTIFAGERCVDLWKNTGHFLIDRYLAKKTDAIITNSSGVVAFYQEHGISAETFVTISNGVMLPDRTADCRQASGKNIDDARDISDIRDRSIEDEKDFGKLPKLTGDAMKCSNESPKLIDEREKLFCELRLPPSRYLIGMVARLWPQKRIKEAIWAADLLKFAGEDFHFLILGDGPQREELIRYRNNIGIQDRVHFLGYRNDVPRFLPYLDMLWNTSEYEGQSNSILEAMSYGVPAIASDIPGNRDLVVDGSTGFLIPEHEGDFRRRSRDLVKRTTLLFGDAAKRTQLGQAAKQRVAEHFTVEQMISRHAELYRQTAATKK
ncbi:MAG: glycosyltransferase [Planctomycetaceae bacterium]|jgi:glycosyltransferase involved in cell wall biosynthesis|nr:glycosyltransferase [Planctomycetaceae bacterium]